MNENYILNSDGTAVVKYIGKAETLYIPHGIKKIGSEAFWGCKTIKKIVVPQSVNYIESRAFMNVPNLNAIELPDVPMHIGSSAFEMTEYYNDGKNWNDGVLYIGTSLIEATPAKKKTRYQILARTKNIATGAFILWDTLEEVGIPDTVEYISKSAFENTEVLKGFRYKVGDSIIIDGHLISYKNAAPNVTLTHIKSIAEYAFEDNTEIETIKLCEGIKAIGVGTFRGCTKLKSVNIPSSVTLISPDAFFLCTSITALDIVEENTCYKSVSGVLFDFTLSELICFPSCNSASDYVVPMSVHSIAPKAFAYSTIKSITLPATITHIGESVFYGCSLLENIEIPFLVPEIPDSAFEECSHLKSVIMHNYVTKIGTRAFADCINLETINISEKLKELHSMAFQCCRSLQDITLPDTMEKIEQEVFTSSGIITNKNYYDEDGNFCINNCFITAAEDLKGDYEVKEGFVILGDGAFYYTDDVTSITLPSTLKYIGSAAFCTCNALTTITIPESVKEIGVDAFAFCNSLSEITVSPYNQYFSTFGGVLFNKKITKLLHYPQNNCNEYFIIPEGVKVIGASAFVENTYLKRVELPNSLAVIEEYAFYRCPALVSVTIPYGVQEIDGFAFNECDNIKFLSLPEHVLADLFFSGIKIKNVERLTVFSSEHSSYDYTIPEDAKWTDFV